jgi:hypothetical protein
MDSGSLNVLPPELIFRILDILAPHEYSGLSCTCRGAVAIVDRKLDNSRDKQELYKGFGWLIDGNTALHTQLPPWKSRTARYVDKRRRRQRDFADLEFARIYGPPCFGWHLDSDGDDPDL